MKLYDCVVRLGGSLVNEVHKLDVTPAEIAVLKELHGQDGVHNVKPALDAKGKPKSVKRTGAEERHRLSKIYVNGELLTAEDFKRKQLMLTNLFGHESLPLPEEYAIAEPVKEADDAVDFAA